LAEVDAAAERSDEVARLGGPEVLTRRQVEVLRLVATGLADDEIGRRLSISKQTVKRHVNAILRRSGATDRTRAVDRARRAELL